MSDFIKRIFRCFSFSTQTPYQRFNFWFLLFSLLTIEVFSFLSWVNPWSHFPVFIVLRTVLVLGWHVAFVLLARGVSKLSAPLGIAVTVLETVLAVGMFVVEAYLLMAYQTTLTDTLCSTILATNGRESLEFLSGIALWQILLVGGSLLVFGVLSFRLGAVLAKWEHRLWMRALCSVSLGVMLTLSAYRAYHCYGLPKPASVNGSCGFDRLVWNFQVARRFEHNIVRELERMRSPEHLQRMEVSSPFTAPVDIVLILGETARADYLHAYGFAKNTSPVLDSLVKSGDAFCFNDARSAANSTIYSGMRLFSFWNDAPNKSWSDFPDLVSVFDRAGYATRWITNQEMVGVSSIERLFGGAAQELLAPKNHSGGGGAGGAYDEALLPLLKDYDELSRKRKQRAPAGLFTVVHLMGSHFLYGARYPERFKCFAPEDVRPSRGELPDRRIAEYMNSLRYTDYLLGALYARYRERPALLVYVSDHGETLYDDPAHPEQFGHGGRPSVEQADVPFAVMLTPAFREAYPELSQRLFAARFRPISTAWLTNTLTLTAGIRTRYSDERYNFFGRQFAPPRPRTTDGEGGPLSFPPVKGKRVL